MSPVSLHRATEGSDAVCKMMKLRLKFNVKYIIQSVVILADKPYEMNQYEVIKIAGMIFLYPV